MPRVGCAKHGTENLRLTLLLGVQQTVIVTCCSPLAMLHGTNMVQHTICALAQCGRHATVIVMIIVMIVAIAVV